MTEEETANPRPTRKTGVWGTRQPKRQEEERFLASLGMTIVFCDGWFGMTGLGESLGLAMIPPLRGPTRHNSAPKKRSGRSGRDDRSRKGKPKTHAQNRRVGHPAVRSKRWDEEGFLAPQTPLGMTFGLDCGEMGRSDAAPLQNRERRICRYSAWR